ncbi:hypothetical protein DL766_002707 [Monosporascus sp. MC13-8B]|uniref:Alpha/beta hydrolase fold-3 domain-containing protein n=1 Tax=Monosporascus cannonballus TaxID=155416 RepID=A0ABY0HK04_9PEZI|nr:hypothetical protein DL762_000717 [Monosporascus cannonballus]RYO98004.1 hypothetical protein DL763_002509 [Monosporascus cannonballus]RYP34993.1 hypothetical protein DL766_002707 [Monosporascus sp. MC13-8B]
MEPTQVAPQLPLFCHRHPTAVVHYRWAGYPPVGDGSATETLKSEGFYAPLHWPTPLHDTLQAYSWILENLMPSSSTRRDVYVYGSYLGASLATSLTLTETHPHQRMGIRGCIAFNGIYNWTTFLPDHPVNKLPRTRSLNILKEILTQSRDPTFLGLKQQAEILFEKTDSLFDPFASPCLFFHTPGIHVPQSFTERVQGSPASKVSVEDITLELLLAAVPPKKSHLKFPPTESTLKIPEMLLIHSGPPLPAPSPQRRQQRRKKEYRGNGFRTQAEELAGLMRRSIHEHELKDRKQWDEDLQGLKTWDEEATRRVQVYDVGLHHKVPELPDDGNRFAEGWLEDRLPGR